MSTPRADVMANFEAIVLQLITEVAAYTAGSAADEAAEANIRKVRTLTAALNAAVMAVPNFPRLMVPSATAAVSTPLPAGAHEAS
ncbi:hypothetical protein AB4Y36_38110 [Paraburkholderia sp. BR10936]|uniref:hypothetical protein n=1 Tax=Paraburkholderia sp. BR10936 TaxID=3236993 RepID=UPI0034D37D79